jgi:hypothetical protein
MARPIQIDDVRLRLGYRAWQKPTVRRALTLATQSRSRICDSDSKKPGWAADLRSVCQQVYPIRQRGS